MTEQRTSNDQSSTAGSSTGSKTGDRAPHAANARVAQLRGGLEKAVTGREAAIKAQALRWAEKLDARTQGRHHNKIHVALKVVEFVVDNVSKRDGDADDASARSERASTGSTQRDSAHRRDPDHLGEFRNLSDDEQTSARR